MATEFDPNEYYTQPGQVPAQPAQAPVPQYQPQPAYPPVQQPVQAPVPQAAPQPYAPPQNPYPAPQQAPQAAPPVPQYQPQAAPQHPPVPQYQPQPQHQHQQHQQQAPNPHQAPQQFQYQAPQAQPYQPGVSPVQPIEEEDAPKKGLLGRLKSRSKKTKSSNVRPAKVKKERAPREGGSSGFLKPYLLGLLTGAILTFGGLMFLGGPAPQKVQPAFEPVAQFEPPVTTQQVAEVIETPTETDPK